MRGDLILSGKDQLIELLFLAGFGLEGGEKLMALGRSRQSTKKITGKEKNLINLGICEVFLSGCTS